MAPQASFCVLRCRPRAKHPFITGWRLGSICFPFGTIKCKLAVATCGLKIKREASHKHTLPIQASCPKN